MYITSSTVVSPQQVKRIFVIYDRSSASPYALYSVPIRTLYAMLDNAVAKKNKIFVPDWILTPTLAVAIVNIYYLQSNKFIEFKELNRFNSCLSSKPITITK